MPGSSVDTQIRIKPIAWNVIESGLVPDDLSAPTELFTVYVLRCELAEEGFRETIRESLPSASARHGDSGHRTASTAFLSN